VHLSDGEYIIGEEWVQTIMGYDNLLTIYSEHNPSPPAM